MSVIVGKYNAAAILSSMEVDEATVHQVAEMCDLKSLRHERIIIMPDCHAGAGCVIGTTMTVSDAVIPNYVGVDIGCGVLAAHIQPTDVDFEKLDLVIRHYIPSGFSVREAGKEIAAAQTQALLDQLLCKEHVDMQRALCAMGTLGGGNHFIELDQDKQSGSLYLMVHTGSRYLGKQVADYYQTLAYKTCNRESVSEGIRMLKQQGREQEIEAYVKACRAEKVPKSYAHLSGQPMQDYLHDMAICQQYAEMNRQTIVRIICDHMGWKQLKTIDTKHNYIDMERHMLRKGAVSAGYGERLVIPMNMRDGTLLCEGLGNSLWNFSAPHGAGRIMSRAKARETIPMETYAESMSGIHTSSVCEGTKDEAPMAYKPMEAVTSAIQQMAGGTVKIISILKPVYNFKASEV